MKSLAIDLGKQIFEKNKPPTKYVAKGCQRYYSNSEL